MVSLIGLLLVAGPLVGLLLVFVHPSQDWFVRVNGEDLTRGELVEVLRAEQISSNLNGGEFDLTARALEVAAELTEDEVLRQQANVLGIQVGNDDIDLWIRRLLLGSGASTLTSGHSQSEIDELLRTYLDQRMLSEQVFRRQAIASVIREQATLALAVTIPAAQPHVHIHRILLPDQEAASFVLGKAEEGIPFDQLAETYSLANDGGDLGWLPYDALPAHIADYLWNAGQLELSLPVSEPDGTFALYVVSERDSERLIEDLTMIVVQDKVLANWVATTFATQDIHVQLDSEIIDWLSNELAKTRLN